MQTTANRTPRYVQIFLGLSLFISPLFAAAPNLIQDFGTAAVSAPGNSAAVTLTLSTLPSPPTSRIGGVDFTALPLTCNSGNTVCSTTITFAPKSPGLKQDALILNDANGNLVATAFLHGIGTAPALQILPATISTLAGNGSWAYADGSATSATFRNPQGLAVDLAGNLYIADSINQVIRKIAAGSNLVSTIAGNGYPGYSGDGGPALSAMFNTPVDVALDPAGNLYIADQGNALIRRRDALTGLISTVAGGGSSTAENVPATSATLFGPASIALDPSGNLYISETYNHLVRKVSAASGLITTVAGGGVAAGSDGIGDGLTATLAQLSNPTGIALDASGNLYIADTGHRMVRRVDSASGVITSVAGTGSQGRMGNGGLAVNAQLWSPTGVRLDAAGNLYIADFGSHQIRCVNSQSGIILTIAGSGNAAYSGDNAMALNAALNNPANIALDPAGNLLIADYSNNVIRKVTFVPPTLAFPSTNISLTSPLVQLSLVNAGNSNLSLSSLAVASPFQQKTSGSTDCSTSAPLSGGTTCQLALAFSPTAAGSFTGTLTINSNNVYSTRQTVSLSGTGLNGTPAATLSSTSLTFASQAVGTTSSQQLVTLSNTGTATLSGINVSLGGLNPLDFLISSTCSSTLAQNSSCTFLVTFQPTLSGTRGATLSVFTAASSSPLAVTLTGTGSGGALPTLSATSLSFASQALNTPSAGQVITLTNSGFAALNISSVALSGVNAPDFALSTTCRSPLAASASCTLTISFTPSAIGTRTAALILFHSAGNSPQAISLSGAGIGIPLPSLSSPALQFGSQLLNSSPATLSLTLTNSGSSSFIIGSTTFTGTNASDFSLAASNCASFLSPSASCTLAINFIPASVGARSANLVFNFAGLSAQTVTLSGTGVNSISTSGTPNSDGVVDDADPRITYSGSWSHNTDTARYLGTQSFSNQSGAAATFAFTGTSVAYVYEMQANAGKAQISIDGVVVTSALDLYSATLQAQKRMVYSGLSYGTHSITVTALGTSNPAASGAYVIVDAFIVGSPAFLYDDADPQVQYVGTWGHNTDIGRYLGTQSFSHTQGDTVTFTFTGTQVTYIFDSQANLGHAQISLDGSVVTADLDQYSATSVSQQRIVYSGLSNNTHTIAVKVLGTKSNAALDSYVIIDAFVVGPASDGFYDDANPLVKFAGGWGHNSDAGRYAGTQSYVNQAGSSASFTFTGTSVAYVFERQGNLGHAQVSIDGAIVSSDINEYSPTRQYQQRVLYTGLSSGSHTITVTALGTRDANSSDAYIIVDAFFVGAPAAAYDDWDPQVIHSGVWGQNTDTGRFNATQSYSKQAGATASLTFQGTGITVLFEKQNNLGHAQVSIDGVIVTADLDEYSTTLLAQQQLAYTGLASGTHIIQISVLGTMDAQSGDSYVVVDGFLISP